MKVSAGVPAKQRQRNPAHRRQFDIEHEAEHRRDHDQRQGRRQPMRDGLGRDRQFERHGAHHQQVERAILVIGGEQPVERQQAGEQRAQPQDRRADLCQQFEVGADGEGHHRDHDEEEQRADQRAAADAHGQPHVANEQGGESAVMRALPMRSVRARAQARSAHAPPPRSCRRLRDGAHQLGQPVLRRRIERRSWLIQKPDRTRDGHQPGDGQPPPLAGRR